MPNLTDIARGWYLFITAPPGNKPLINARLEKCDTCEYKLQLSETGKVIVQAINQSASVYKCGYCACPLAAKTSDPSGSCPIGRW